MLVWRKRAQRRANFDLFYGDTLAAASGFQPSGSSSPPSSSAAAEQPIYGRSAPEDEKYEMNGGVVVGGAALNRKVSSNAPRRSRSHTSNHTNKSPHMQSSAPQPPLLMPMHPLPTAAGAGQDASYFHQQHQQDSYYANQQYQQQQDYYASQHQHHQQQQQQQPPKRKPSYRLPRHHPGFDYEYEQSVGQH
ncbi:hypothetical protein BGZ97_009929 [Linnemannia gamsii]|uniref:Uncharacterized protein n=1 Tax=Linnemannia gamsii TaxID=64522 RepID=A0A9P6R6Z9_9FUNG|nr:hypothetical protein BGZ97_009929 [Linnemannia gamsii]